MSLREESKEVKLISGKDDFETIKALFKEEINSARRFEKISNLEDLLEALEDRDALTEDILKELDPDFQRRFTQKPGKQKSSLPPKVFKFLTDNYDKDWKELGVNLKLNQLQINKCNDVATVLTEFENNCMGISSQEILFRLNRALEKCKEKRLKAEVLKLAAES